MELLEQSERSGSSVPSVCGGSGKPIRLTAKQMRLLDLVAAGHTYVEIAQIEGVKENSVAVTMYRLAERLHIPVTGRHGIRRWLARNGWDVAAGAI